MSDAKSICVACVGIFIVLVIIGGVLNVVEDHMGWNNDSEITNTPTPTPVATQKATVSQTSVSSADTMYKSYFTEANNKIQQILDNFDSNINSGDLSSIRKNGKELNSVCIYYTDKIESLSVSSKYQNSKQNYLAMLDCFAATGNYLMDAVDYHYDGEESHSERYFGYAADELKYGMEYLKKAY